MGSPDSSSILNAPALKMGDAFDSFALFVQSLVGMLRTLEGQNGYELSVCAQQDACHLL